MRSGSRRCSAPTRGSSRPAPTAAARWNARSPGGPSPRRAGSCTSRSRRGRRCLAGRFRRQRVSGLSASADLGRALPRLRGGVRGHVVAAGGRRVSFGGFVADFDRRPRAEGFPVLHDWDGQADRVNPDTIPVDVVNYLIEVGGGGPPDPAAVAILLDYYLFNILCLLSLRIPDAGGADDNLERLGRLLDRLQGTDGSGPRFAGHAGTLILVATAHF